MKMNILQEQEREEVVAMFGQGRLVQLSRLRVELRGGSKEDEMEAVGWISMFMPDVVLATLGGFADMDARKGICVASQVAVQ